MLANIRALRGSRCLVENPNVVANLTECDVNSTLWAMSMGVTFSIGPISQPTGRLLTNPATAQEGLIGQPAELLT